MILLLNSIAGDSSVKSISVSNILPHHFPDNISEQNQNPVLSNNVLPIKP